MNLAVWADRNGVARVRAYRWFRVGLLPVPARKVGRLILVNDPAAETAGRGRTAVYARAWSADQKPDLDRQVAQATSWATTAEFPVDMVVTEVGSALNSRRRKFLVLLRDRSLIRIVAEHGERFCRRSEYVQAALAAQGPELVVVDADEVDDDLVRDMTGILTPMCARLYGKPAGGYRATRALAAAATQERGAA
jgi:predicted site-specific integrase-resolvase